MDRRILFVGAVLAVVLAGCTAQTGSVGSGQFELLISDAPADIDDFDSLTVTFSDARVFRAGAEEVNESEDANDSEAGEAGFEVIDIQGQQVDLTQVKGARAESLVNTTLEAGNYTKIELRASDVTGVVNGSMVQVKLPSEKLQIVRPFTIAPNTTTRFVFDINVVLRGNERNNEGYILKPVISKSGVVGEDVGEPEGPGEDDSDDEDGMDGEGSAGNESSSGNQSNPTGQ